jgi:protease PrsW
LRQSGPALQGCVGKPKCGTALPGGVDDQTALWILAALAFLPPLAFALWVRAHEQHRREPILAVLGLFLYGATVGVAMAIFLNEVFGLSLASASSSAVNATFLAVVVGAPILEELSKGLGLGLARRRMMELEDGIIYGAAIGLGFAATENILYTYTAWVEDGFGAGVVTAAVRSISSTLLHGGSSALLGYGYGLMILRGTILPTLLPYYLLAILQHAVYNALVISQTWAGFFAAVAMVIVVAAYLRKRIAFYDALTHKSGARAPPG